MSLKNKYLSKKKLREVEEKEDKGEISDGGRGSSLYPES
jgi:hypothetical protein